MRPSLSMTIGSDPGEAAGVARAFAEFADAHRVPAAARRSVSVALDELLHNTIAYGFGGRPDGTVSIEVELRPDRLCVTLSDNGAPFNPLEMSAPDTALPVEERQIGGLGIHLARRMMDEMVYQRRADRNVVSLAKLLAGGSAAGGGGGQAMDITTRTQNGVTLVVFAGSLDSNTSPQAQQALDGVLAAGARKMVVDCTALDYISSAGLRVLLGTAKRLSGAGGAGGAGGGLRLFGLNQTVREVFDISGFSTILAVFNTEADALKGF
ncbi:MAG TPA: anti-sigma factor antagonist [Gemmatimonadales bacterium]|nr:anti-sigma factor antagonist [Gemmatimonadales bacterium]